MQFAICEALFPLGLGAAPVLVDERPVPFDTGAARPGSVRGRDGARYCLGDKVASKIDFDGQNLKVGNIGVITGPCPNKDLADQAKRVRVVFGPGIGQLDLVAEGSLQINPAENLCDGWCLGDRCASRIDYDAQNLCVDDIGTVIGPCPNDKLKDQKVMPNVIACMRTHLSPV